MRVHQITRARTLSFALAAVGLLAVAAPASAAEEVKTRVKPNNDVSSTLQNPPRFDVRYRVGLELRSPEARCRIKPSALGENGIRWADDNDDPNGRKVKLVNHPGVRTWFTSGDPDAKLSWWAPYSRRAARGHYRVKIKVTRSDSSGGVICKGDKSPWVTFPRPCCLRGPHAGERCREAVTARAVG
jgi:hypothetical protein